MKLGQLKANQASFKANSYLANKLAISCPHMSSYILIGLI